MFTHRVSGANSTLVTISCIWHSRASRNNPAFDRFDFFLVSLYFERAFERSSSADTADFKQGIQKYDCLYNEFSKDLYKNKYIYQDELLEKRNR